MSRTINIKVTSWIQPVLTFSNPQSQEGPAAKVSGNSSIGYGQTLTATATNDHTFNGGNKGTFVLSTGSSPSYTVFYTHPQLSGSSYIKLQSGAPASSIAGIGEPTYSGDPIPATMNLYHGVAEDSATSTPCYADFTNQSITGDDSRPLYTHFSQWGITQREDFANSHYKGSLTYNNTGLYYLNITDQWAPEGCGLILSLLFGSTVNGSRNPPTGQYNTFMQLEGWPASGMTGGDRHSADYDAYKQTLWNISTYGAAPY